jgi:chromosome partitioning protein
MNASDPVFDAAAERPFVLVFANEKGGTGKSTLSFHAIVSLLKCGYSVGSIDADIRQGTLSRYLENRVATAGAHQGQLPVPDHVRLGDSGHHDETQDETAAVAEAQCVLAGFGGYDFVVIDTPGTVNSLTCFAVSNADTLVSPINDSYVDIDVIAELNMAKREVVGPSQFTRLVWEASNRRIADRLPPTDWMVLRNRLTHIDSRNKRDIADLMQKLASRIGFRSAAGFGERAVYRELFHSGLTVMDTSSDPARRLSPSHAAAADEVIQLLREIGIGDSEIAAI